MTTNFLAPELLVVIIAPDGVRLDVTDRLSDIGQLTEAVEDTTLVPVHSDIDILLDDRDGEVDSFLANVTTAGRFAVEIWRDMHVRRGWQKLFSGVLDLPDSLDADRNEDMLSIQVFGVTKILENTSAAAVVRTFPALGAGTVSASSRVVTLGSTVGLASGDSIRLFDDTNDEEQVVDRVTSGTALRTVAAFTNPFTAAGAEILTPYYRWQAPSWLAAELVDQCDLPAGSIGITGELSTLPIVTPMSQDGLTQVATPGSVVESAAGELEVVFGAGSDTNDKGRYHGTPQGSFTRTVGTSTARGDWTPYLLTRPAAFPTTTGIFADNGIAAWDHTNSRVYYLSLNLNVGIWTLRLEQNGSVVENIFTDGDTPQFWKLEYSALYDDVWVSWRKHDNTSGIQVWETSSGILGSVIAGSASGHLRAVRALGWMLWLSEDLLTLKVYDHTTNTVIKAITGDAIPPGLILWTVRYLDGQLFGAYVERGRARLRIWDISWTVLADYELGPVGPVPTGTANTAQRNPVTTCVYDDPTFGKVGIIWVDTGSVNSFGVLCKRFAGVVPYADLEETSVATAMADLAVLTLGVLTVDQEGKLSILPRTLTGTADHDIDDRVLEERERRLWSGYHTSVKVTGRNPVTGEAVEATVGSDAGKRADIDCRLASTESLCFAIASFYAQFLSRERREREAKITEDGEIVRPLSIVYRDGARWLVLSAGTHANEREQELELVEVTE